MADSFGEIYLRLWMFGLNLLLLSISAFNIDVSPDTAATFKINMPGMSNGSIYAGYKLSGSIENHKLRLLAGAPKYHPNPQHPYLTNGTIVECLIALDVFRTQFVGTTLQDSIEPNCSIYLVEDKLTLGDNHLAGSNAIGLTLFPITDTELAVCTSGQHKKCQTSKFSPGACFRGASPDQFNPIKWNEKRCFLHYVDVLYLVDSSGSISDADFATMRNIMLSVSDVFTNIIGDTTQVAILQYGQNTLFDLQYSSTNTLFYQQPVKFGQCHTVVCLKEAIESNMNHLKSPSTFTATAIKRATLIDFAESKNAAIAQKILILITDGAANDDISLDDSYSLTQTHNITVYAIGVGNKINQGQLKTSANGGKSNDRVLTTNDFSQLLTTLDSLTQKISEDNTEGQTAISVENATENALFGFSGVKTKSGEVAFGAIGAYQNLGTIVKYKSTELSNLEMLTFEEVNTALPEVTKDTYDSYLGYDITSGNFEGGLTTYVAAAAPRYQLLGAAVIFQTQGRTNFTIQAPTNFQQHGSYFGASLISCDVDNDSRDDLLVGAPLYIGENYDEGRVFVYSSFNGSSAKGWASSSYQPLVLTGGHIGGGRFGTTMTCAGDLDQDSYNDVIIAAPYAEKGKGVVYVYSGSVRGLVDKPSQVITASSLTYPGIASFGLSLEVGIDVDSNQYPDVVIGSPHSDVITVLRSLPVVDIDANLTFNRENIDIIDCLLTLNANCGHLTACFTYTGKAVESTLDIKYEIQIDMILERVLLRTNAASLQGVTTHTQTIKLEKETPACVTLDVDAQPNMQDFDTPVTVNLTYSLSDLHKNQPMASIQRRTDNAYNSATIPFEKSCGNDSKCYYDLSILGNVRLPVVFHPSSEELLGGGVTLIVASDDLVVVQVNLTNKGEIAYGTRMAVSYSNGFSWRGVQNVKSSTSSQTCVANDLGETVSGDLRTNVLSYQHNRLLNEVMLPASWCYFECLLATGSFALEGNKTDVDIRLFAYTYVGNQEDLDSSDNSWNSTHGVKYRSDVDVRRLSIQQTLEFNFTEETAVIGSVYGIGNGTPDIPIEYEIQGRGYSNIPKSMLFFKYPRFFNETQRLLYLRDVQCETYQGNAFCVCNKTGVNPLNLSLFETLEGGNQFNITPNPYELEPDFFDCTVNNSDNTTSCDIVQCHVTDLGDGDVIRFRAVFRLWTHTLRIPGNTSVSFKSEFTFSATESPQIIDAYGKSLPPKTSQVTITAQLKTARPEVPRSQSLVVFFVAVGVGIVILAIIVAVMYKLGFFESKYAEMKEEQLQWQSANPQERHISPYDLNPEVKTVDEGLLSK